MKRQTRRPRPPIVTNHRGRQGGTIDEAERVEHVFGLTKRLWDFGKVHDRGLAKNATRSFVAPGLANIDLVRARLAA